jgi:hypothetical protein
MILQVLLSIFPTLDAHSNSFVSTTTVRLVKSLSESVNTNELERESREGKINSKISKIIRWDSWYKWARVTVKSGMILLDLLLISPTFDAHSNSFVSTAWPNDFTSLTVNLPHSWLSL